MAGYALMRVIFQIIFKKEARKFWKEEMIVVSMLIGALTAMVAYFISKIE